MYFNLVLGEMKMPKVSIIVPVYKVESLLSRCLTSLAKQTLKDFEVIIVNDGSPDNCQAIIDDFVQKNSAIFKAFKKENGGLSDARNFGIKKATGEYIGFVDSDDFVDPQMFEKLYQKATKTNSDIVVCGHNSVYFNRSGKINKSIPRPICNPSNFGSNIYDSPEIITCVRSYAWNKIYKKELFDEFSFPKGQYFEDSAIIYNILSKARSIEIVNECLYQYCCGRKGAITSTVNQNIFDIFKSCDSIIKHFKKIGKFEILKQELESICTMHIHARYFTLKNSNNLKLVFRFVNHSFEYLDKNFPNWQNNKYYLSRRATPLTSHPTSPFELARESSLNLKLYFLKNYFKRLASRLLKPWRKAFKKTVKLLKSKSQKSAYKKISKNAELTQHELRELQLQILEIYKTFIEFCNKHNLRYYLFEGTLLGAVRHNGFIPWDDDLDVAMPRQDYQKFVRLWNIQKINNCILSHNSTYKSYYLTFSKLSSVKKTEFHSLLHTNLKIQPPLSDICIDIFPLDNCGPVNLDLFRRVRKIRKLRNILLAKVGYFKNPKKKRAYRFYKTIKSFDSLHKALYKLYTRDAENSQFIANFASSYILTKEHFPKNFFEPARTIDFEGIPSTIPAKSEQILLRIYGDYSVLPPAEKRKPPHKYIIKNN